MARPQWIALGLLAGCAPANDFDKISQGQFTCPELAPFGLYESPACYECLRSHCCDEVSACRADATCSAGLDTPLTPVAALPESKALDTAIGCLQALCDAECGLSFGCEGSDYAAPTEERDAQLLLRNFGTTEQLVQPVDVGLCGTVMEFCSVDADTSVRADATGLVALPFPRDQLAASFAVEDASYVQDEADPLTNPNHYPPHNVGWSEPLPSLGSPMPEFLFSTRSVGFLVTQAAGDTSFDPASSHIVFYLHSCLPLTRYLARSNYPAGGIGGANIVLSHLGQELPAERVVYRLATGAYQPGESSLLGSGGVANVEPGLWSASASIRLADGSEHKLTSAFQVPAGGVGVVHLFPHSN